VDTEVMNKGILQGEVWGDGEYLPRRACTSGSPTKAARCGSNRVRGRGKNRTGKINYDISTILSYLVDKSAEAFPIGS